MGKVVAKTKGYTFIGTQCTLNVVSIYSTDLPSKIMLQLAVPPDKINVVA